MPWFAIALRAGQQERLSVGDGGVKGGQERLQPACGEGTTWPALRDGVSRLSSTSDVSHSVT